MKTKLLHIMMIDYVILYGFPHIFLQLPTGHSPHQNNLPTPHYESLHYYRGNINQGVIIKKYFTVYHGKNPPTHLIKVY